MKIRSQNLFLLPALIAGLGLILAGRVTAQTFTTLHSFANSNDGAANQRRSNPYRIDFIGQHPVWDGSVWRQFGQWHGVRRQHRWHGFYEPA